MSTTEVLIDEAFEEKVLACIYTVNQFCAVAVPHLKPAQFGTVFKNNLAKIGIDFFTRYQVAISKHAFAVCVNELVDRRTINATEADTYLREYDRLRAVDCTDWAFVLDQLLTFIKNKEWRNLITLAVTKHLPKNNFDAIEKEVRRIQAITANAEVKAYDYWAEKNVVERGKRRHEEKLMRRIGITTGIKKMDDALHKGGWFEKELYLLMAPPKRGKSMALYWFANMASLAGFNVAVFSCENSRQVVTDRIDAMNSGVETRRLTEDVIEVAKRVKAAGSRAGAGHLLVYEYPTVTLTCSEVARQVERLQIERGITINMIVVDYLDIMKPEYRREDRLVEEADITKGLRALAGRFVCPVLTATQVNRAGSDKALIKGRDVRGTWDKIADADTVVTFSATEDELKEGLLRIHFSESRNSPSRTFTIRTSYNFGKFYKEFVSEEL